MTSGSNAEPPIADLLDYMKTLTERAEKLEQTVAAKDDQIEEFQQRASSFNLGR